jgi:hypothetical protein
MQVIVKLRPECAPDSDIERDLPPPKEVTDMVSSAGCQLYPMHPNSRDAELKLYYCVDVLDEPTGSTLATRLSHSNAVEGAYVKPPDALP